MTHGDCASAGQCGLDGVEKSNRAVGVTAENKLTVFSFAGRGIYTQQVFFSVHLNDANYGFREKAHFCF